MDQIFDYEIAALQAILGALAQADRDKMRAQLGRYDRIDRSTNRRKMRLIDDDSDFRRSDWPREILFPGEDTDHVADVELFAPNSKKATVRARAFLVFGRFDGCEFDPSKTRGEVVFEQFRMPLVMDKIETVPTQWATRSVKLFAPFGAERSQMRFDPAE